jgi:hypothetical protein
MEIINKNNKHLLFKNLPSLVTGGFKPAKDIGIGWIPFEYKFDDFAGTGLATGAHSSANELVLNLNLKGWHRLYLAHTPSIRVWLDGDKGYCEIPGFTSDIRDYAFPAADFTGKNLHISPVHGKTLSRELIVFYLRAESCEPYNSRRNLIATNDGHGIFWSGIDCPRDIYRHILPFKDSDFFRMIWGLYGGGLIGTWADLSGIDIVPRDDSKSFYANHWVLNQSIRNVLSAGVDPLTVVRDATREIGMELHFYFRVGAFYAPFPIHSYTTQFFNENPQWHCCDEFGHKVKRISYAYPEVQDKILSYFEKVLEYEPEGLCLSFNRGLPLMICEEPVINAFEQIYGRKPSLPEEVDSSEMLSVRYQLLTDFIARVHKLVSKHGKVLSCIVPRDFEKNKIFGLDIEILVSKGFIESVMIGAGHKDNPVLNEHLEPLKILKSLGTKIYAGGSDNIVLGNAWVKGNLAARAGYMAKILDAGLDGGFFWDAESIIGTEWEPMRCFGNRTILSEIINGEWPKVNYHDTKYIYDLVVDRYNPWNAY